MSAANVRGPWLKQIVTAAQAGGAISGVPIIEEGFAGIPELTVPQGAKYALDVRQEIVELATTLITTAGPFTPGQTVWIGTAAPFALQVTAAHAAAPASTIAFGRIVATPAVTFDSGTAPSGVPAAGFVWVALLPQLP